MRSQLSNKNQTYRLIGIVAVIALAIAAVVYLVKYRTQAGTEITTASGLKYTDIVVGTGASPKAGQTVVVNYVGTLENGKEFDSTQRHGGQPSEFQIGVGRVIKGWDEGLMSMKVGGKRRLVVPADIGYGARGRPPDIPGGATLIFEVELVDLKG